SRAHPGCWRVDCRPPADRRERQSRLRQIAATKTVAARVKCGVSREQSYRESPWVAYQCRKTPEWRLYAAVVKRSFRRGPGTMPGTDRNRQSPGRMILDNRAALVQPRDTR